MRLYQDYFFQRQEKLWRDNAMRTLPALMNSSDMLACGEDLGMVPDCVYPVLFSSVPQLMYSTLLHNDF